MTTKRSTYSNEKFSNEPTKLGGELEQVCYGIKAGEMKFMENLSPTWHHYCLFCFYNAVEKRVLVASEYLLFGPVVSRQLTRSGRSRATEIQEPSSMRESK